MFFMYFFPFLTSVMNWDNVVGNYPILPLQHKGQYHYMFIKHIDLLSCIFLFSLPIPQSLKPEERNRERSRKS